MKNKLKLLKTGLLALLLCTLINSSLAQLAAPVPTIPIDSKSKLGLGTLDDGVGTVTDQANTILFYKETGGVSVTGLTLRASLTDDNSTDPLEFTSYRWYKMGYDGTTETPAEISGQTTRDLALTALQPGYYKYRVYGLVEDGTVLCQSEEFQDIIFFVLRPLDPTASAAANSLAGFCIGEEASAADLVLNSTVEFSAIDYQGGSYPNPAVGNFDLAYRWYAVKKGDVSNTKIYLQTTPVNSTGAANTFTLSDYTALADAATYQFFVEVQYSEAIKQRDNREHALWTARVGGDTPYELIVSPKPGRPTITIETVND
ncbi:hypothetical protein SAMN05660841_03761 [Sphingobacterium nematocida]|uniref:Uncharacterized protein n=1 Tax=Sphingobacterium nematocida TaxID=1513896 RepID=A0A1T5G4G9_9SPHI|nr:hypothetical protein [Sphingobacterium nematocida]SKC03355.1 hypothetical protein SAMN05660841_03761 [Sphingobacterium nematocida]